MRINQNIGDQRYYHLSNVTIYADIINNTQFPEEKLELDAKENINNSQNIKIIQNPISAVALYQNSCNSVSNFDQKSKLRYCIWIYTKCPEIIIQTASKYHDYPIYHVISEPCSLLDMSSVPIPGISCEFSVVLQLLSIPRNVSIFEIM